MPFRALSLPDLMGLADALESGRLGSPLSASAVARIVSPDLAVAATQELQRLAGAGLAPPNIAYCLRLLSAERRERQQAGDRLQLVWTGPETQGSRSRDTGVVVEELFSRAERSILVAGFAVHRGKHVFKTLAERMRVQPTMEVRLFLNVPRTEKQAPSEAECLRIFADRFRRDHWSGERLPVVFYDPRSLAPSRAPRAVLHAKCVVVDLKAALVTSANFTEAAQLRNIEAGVLVEDEAFARELVLQFDTLVNRGALLRLPL